MARRAWTPRSSATQASANDTALAFDIKTDLRGFLAALKEVDPRIARAVRRKMRQAGDAAIAAMGDILDEYGGGVVTGKTHKLGKDRRGRRRIVVSGVKTRAATRSRSSGAREQIKAGLKFRVTAGKSRTTVRLTSTSGELRKALNRKHSWRHPVFGTDAWVEQPADAYFTRGGVSQIKQMKADLEDAIREGLDALDGRTFRPDQA